MIAKKKQTRLKPIGRTPSARVKERGDSIGRTVKGKKPRQTRIKDMMGPKILPRTKPKVKISGVGGAAVGGALAGLSQEAIIKAVKKLMRDAKPTGRPKRKFGPITPKRGKPKFMKK